MRIISLLLIVPIICISFSIYIMTLINFITINEFDIMMFTISIIINIILSFVTLRLIIKNNENSPFVNNLDNNFPTYYGYFSFIILGLFGISLIINSFIQSINMFNLLIGIVIIVLFFIITFICFIKNDEILLLLTDINPVNSQVNLLYLCDETDVYTYHVSSKSIYQENKKYICLINKHTKRIIKIKGAKNHE